MGKGIHGWIGGRFGSPTEYGLPLDPSYLYEEEDRAEDEPAQPCACQGAEWIGCECQLSDDPEDWLPVLEEDGPDDDWTPVPAPSSAFPFCISNDILEFTSNERR